jgi:hypothetical protein
MIDCDISAMQLGDFVKVHIYFEALWSILFPGELPPYSESFKGIRVETHSKTMVQSEFQFPTSSIANPSGDPVVLDSSTGNPIELKSSDLFQYIFQSALKNLGFDVAIFDQLCGDIGSKEATPRNIVRVLQIKRNSIDMQLLEDQLLKSKAAILDAFNAQRIGAPNSIINSLNIDYKNDLHFIVLAFQKLSDHTMNKLQREGITVLTFEDVLKLYSPSLEGLNCLVSDPLFLLLLVLDC